MNKKSRRRLNKTRIILCCLIISQLCTFGYINSIRAEIMQEKLNAQICAEELIPLDTIPTEELE